MSSGVVKIRDTPRVTIREAWLSMFRHGKGSKARRDARSWPGSRRLAAARNLASSNQSAWLGASSLLSLQNPPM